MRSAGDPEEPPPGGGGGGGGGSAQQPGSPTSRLRARKVAAAGEGLAGSVQAALRTVQVGRSPPRLPPPRSRLLPLLPCPPPPVPPAPPL
jgi:hypothetical protein